VMSAVTGTSSLCSGWCTAMFWEVSTSLACVQRVRFKSVYVLACVCQHRRCRKRKLRACMRACEGDRVYAGDKDRCVPYSTSCWCFHGYTWWWCGQRFHWIRTISKSANFPRTFQRIACACTRLFLFLPQRSSLTRRHSMPYTWVLLLMSCTRCCWTNWHQGGAWSYLWDPGTHTRYAYCLTVPAGKVTLVVALRR
jgi:hypothetical protein